MKVQDIMNPLPDYLTQDNSLMEGIIKMRSVTHSHGQGVKHS